MEMSRGGLRHEEGVRRGGLCASCGERKRGSEVSGAQIALGKFDNNVCTERVL